MWPPTSASSSRRRAWTCSSPAPGARRTARRRSSWGSACTGSGWRRPAPPPAGGGPPAPPAPREPQAVGAIRTIFPGRLDHRYAPGVLAAMDVLVVPSILDEAFGMVAAEGAAAGALTRLRRHSGPGEGG